MEVGVEDEDGWVRSLFVLPLFSRTRYVHVVIVPCVDYIFRRYTAGLLSIQLPDEGEQLVGGRRMEQQFCCPFVFFREII
jgi:hypothetical protein